MFDCCVLAGLSALCISVLIFNFRLVSIFWLDPVKIKDLLAEIGKYERSVAKLYVKFQRIQNQYLSKKVTLSKPQSVHVFSAALPGGWRRPSCLLHLEAARLLPPTPVLTVPASPPPPTTPGATQPSQSCHLSGRQSGWLQFWRCHWSPCPVLASI